MLMVRQRRPAVSNTIVLKTVETVLEIVQGIDHRVDRVEKTVDSLEKTTVTKNDLDMVMKKLQDTLATKMYVGAITEDLTRNIKASKHEQEQRVVRIEKRLAIDK